MAELQVHDIPQDDDKPIDISRHVAVLRSRFWIILLCVLIFVSFRAIRVFRQAPYYQAQAELYIERQPRRARGVEAELGAESQYEYRTAVKLIRCREVMEQALQNEEVAALFPPIGKSKLKRESRSVVRWLLSSARAVMKHAPTRSADPWERLRGSVGVVPDPDTSLVKITVGGGSPQKCMLIANAVAEAFVEFGRSLRERGDVEVFRELKRQLEQQEERLAAARKAIREYRDEHGLVKVGLAASEDTETMEKYKGLKRESDAALALLEKLEAQYDAVKARAAEVDEDRAFLRRVAILSDSNPRVKYLSDQQGQIARDINLALKSFGPKHTKVLELRAREESLEKDLREAVSVAVRLLEDSVGVARKRSEGLVKSTSGERQRLEELGRISSHFKELQADYDLERRTYETLREQLKGVDLRRGFEANNIRLIEKATLPARAIGPDRKRAIMVGAFMGLVIGLGIAYFLEYLDDTVKTPDDLEKQIRVVPLGFVPDIQTVNEGREGFIERAQHSLMFPVSSTTEAFRAVRTNIYFSGEREHMKSLLVTSAAPGDGKTSFTSNLAITFAQDGKKVLIVDSDLRRPMLHHAFGVNREPGLSNLLVEGLKIEDVVQTMPEGDGTRLETLRVLTAGSKTPNPAELMAGIHMRQFMARAREDFDLVIYDSCPILLVSDAAMVSEGCDGALLIVKAGRSRRDAVLRARKQLESVSVKVIGAVLNGVGAKALRGQRYGYYYGYGYGSGYGYGYGSGYHSDAAAGSEAGASRDAKTDTHA